MEFVKNVIIRNTRILWPNFAGAKKKFNDNGARTCGVVIPDPEMAQQMLEDGWNVRMLAPRNPDEQPTYYMNVEARYNKYPPKVIMITGNHRTELFEDNIDKLDFAEIRNVKMSVRPHQWHNDRTDEDCIKGFIKTLYVEVEADEFEDEYGFDDESADNEKMPF